MRACLGQARHAVSVATNEYAGISKERPEFHNIVT
jgi:hypothetical protein